MPRTIDDKPLSPHFMLSEFTVSAAATRAGLPNEHLAIHERNMTRVAVVMERVRALLGDVPIVIHSGYRSPAVNKLIGGSKTSAHMQGLAVDFTAPRFGDPRSICRAVVDGGIVFDQLIYEGTWVHLGLAEEGVPPRRQVLTAFFQRGERTRYEAGLL